MDKIEGLRHRVEKEIKRRIRIIVMTAQEFAESCEMILKRPYWRML